MGLMDELDMGSYPGGNMKAFKKKLAEVHASPPWMTPVLKEASEWNPYSFEGGTTAAIAGDNFAIMASDTRMSQFEINILTRDAEKIHVLNDSIVLSCAGFYGDILQLKRLLEARLHKYRFDYRGDMTVDLCAELLSRNLYYRRFFPYYTGAILAGIDENGKGAVFSYDPIGCIEHIAYTASGSAEPMIMPFFDCQVDCILHRLCLFPCFLSSHHTTYVVVYVVYYYGRSLFFLNCLIINTRDRQQDNADAVRILYIRRNHPVIGLVTMSGDVEKPLLTIERATSLIKDAFRVAAEREISTGDKIHLVIAEAGKPIRKMHLPLRED
ncbi:unnamed protein product [Brugia pahangi]|uniref:Proteasome subunit beta n=1 Tax=Brugia pahangi TaxID=6280 RepID=A0A0N4TSK0_BRUPA|nr:unnamed protein product [Brugia pahangi]